MNRAVRCEHGFAVGLVPCLECESAAAGKPVPPPEGNTRPNRKRAPVPGVKRVYLCKVCKGSGHGSRTCAQRKADAAKVGRPNPNLNYCPVPAEFAEPAPKRSAE